MQRQGQHSFEMDHIAYSSREGRGGNNSLAMGLLAAVFILLSGVLTSSQPLQFVNVEGILIVLGGTIASTLIQFSLSDLRNAIGALRSAFITASCSPRQRMEALLDLSQRVKQYGILTLEEEAQGEPDDFFRLGLMLVADGRTLDDTKRILRIEMTSSRDREWRAVQVWETMGNFAPAMGLIGTLLGLIQMLGAMHDAASVGTSMAMALVATLYGSVSANLFFFPVAGKLRLLSAEREQCKIITLEGLLSISRLENPMMLEQRLQSFSSIVVNG